MKAKGVILSPEAEEVYLYLVKHAPSYKKESTILSALQQKVELIKEDTHYGNPIKKDLIPKEYIIRYQITNLFRIELPYFWRMFYTLKPDSANVEILAIVVDILDHDEYNKKFGYRKK